MGERGDSDGGGRGAKQERTRLANRQGLCDHRDENAQGGPRIDIRSNDIQMQISPSPKI